MSMDFDDNDDFSFGDEMDFDGGSAPVDDNRNPASKVIGGTAAAFTEQFELDTLADTASNFSGLIGGAMGGNVGEFDSLADDTMGLAREAGKEIKKSSNKLYRLARNYVPDTGIFGSMKTSLDEFFNEDERGNTPSGPDHSAMALAAVAEALGTPSPEDPMETLRKKKEELVNLSSNKLLGSLNAEAVYNRESVVSTQNKFYRKSLQIQFQHMYLTREALELNKASSIAERDQLAIIAKNTALPEIQKLQATEIIKQVGFTSIASAMTDKFVQRTPIIENLKRKVNSVLTGFAESADMAETVGDMGDDMAPDQLIAMMASDKINQYVSETVGGNLRKTERGSNAVASFNELMANPGDYLKDKADGMKDGVFKKATSFFGDVFESGTSNNLVTSTIADRAGAAVYTNETNNSIVRVIPDLLSKILFSVKELDPNVKDNEEIRWNYMQGRFDVKPTDVVASVKKVSAGSLEAGKVGHRLSDFVSSLATTAKVKLSKKEASSLEMSMLNLILDGKGSSLKQMMKNGLLEGVEEHSRSNIASMLTAYEEVVSKAGEDKYKYGETFNKTTKAISSGIKSISPVISKMVSDGGRAELQDAGLIKTVGGQDRLSKDSYNKMIKENIRSEIAREKYAEAYNPDTDINKIIFTDTTKFADSINGKLKSIFKTATLTKLMDKAKKLGKDAKDYAKKDPEEIKKDIKELKDSLVSRGNELREYLTAVANMTPEERKKHITNKGKTFATSLKKERKALLKSLGVTYKELGLPEINVDDYLNMLGTDSVAVQEEMKKFEAKVKEAIGKTKETVTKTAKKAGEKIAANPKVQEAMAKVEGNKHVGPLIEKIKEHTPTTVEGFKEAGAKATKTVKKKFKKASKTIKNNETVQNALEQGIKKANEFKDKSKSAIESGEVYIKSLDHINTFVSKKIKEITQLKVDITEEKDLSKRDTLISKLSKETKKIIVEVNDKVKEGKITKKDAAGYKELIISAAMAPMPRTSNFNNPKNTNKAIQSSIADTHGLKTIVKSVLKKDPDYLKDFSKNSPELIKELKATAEAEIRKDMGEKQDEKDKESKKKEIEDKKNKRKKSKSTKERIKGLVENDIIEEDERTIVENNPKPIDYLKAIADSTGATSTQLTEDAIITANDKVEEKEEKEINRKQAIRDAKARETREATNKDIAELDGANKTKPTHNMRSTRGGDKGDMRAGFVKTSTTLGIIGAGILGLLLASSSKGGVTELIKDKITEAGSSIWESFKDWGGDKKALAAGGAALVTGMAAHKVTKVLSGGKFGLGTVAKTIATAPLSTNKITRQPFRLAMRGIMHSALGIGRLLMHYKKTAVIATGAALGFWPEDTPPEDFGDVDFTKSPDDIVGQFWDRADVLEKVGAGAVGIGAAFGAKKLSSIALKKAKDAALLAKTAGTPSKGMWAKAGNVALTLGRHKKKLVTTAVGGGLAYLGLGGTEANASEISGDIPGGVLPVLDTPMAKVKETTPIKNKVKEVTPKDIEIEEPLTTADAIMLGLDVAMVGQMVKWTYDKVTGKRSIGDKTREKLLAGWAKKSAAKAVAKAAAEATAKAAAKAVAKKAAIQVAKRIPGAGLVIGAGLAKARWAKGEYFKAIAEVASGAVGTLPFAGTALSIAIDGGLLASDVADDDASTGVQEPKVSKEIMETPIEKPKRQAGRQRASGRQEPKVSEGVIETPKRQARGQRSKPMEVTQSKSTVGRNRASDADKNMKAIKTPAIQSGKIPKVDMMLLDQIAAAEGTNDDYNMMFGGYKYIPYTANISEMTISEVFKYQIEMSKVKKWKALTGFKSTVAGRYQFKDDTLAEVVKSMKDINENSIFSPYNQSRLAIQRLNVKRKYGDWKSGKITDTEFMHNLSKEWASIGDPNDGGKSFHNQSIRGPGSLASIRKLLKDMRSVDPKEMVMVGGKNDTDNATPPSKVIAAKSKESKASDTDKRKEADTTDGSSVINTLEDFFAEMLGIKIHKPVQKAANITQPSSITTGPTAVMGDVNTAKRFPTMGKFGMLGKKVKSINEIPKSTRMINGIVVHCTATQVGKAYNAMSIDAMHKANGWSGIGYHFLILLDGSIEYGRNINDIGAHVGGYNLNTIGISYVGGVTIVGGKTLNAVDKTTPEQAKSIINLSHYLAALHGLNTDAIKGHNEYPKVAKACPNLTMSTIRGGTYSGEALPKDTESTNAEDGKGTEVDENGVSINAPKVIKPVFNQMPINGPRAAIKGAKPVDVATSTNKQLKADMKAATTNEIKAATIGAGVKTAGETIIVTDNDSSVGHLAGIESAVTSNAQHDKDFKDKFGSFMNTFEMYMKKENIPMQAPTPPPAPTPKPELVSTKRKPGVGRR